LSIGGQGERPVEVLLRFVQCLSITLLRLSEAGAAGGDNKRDIRRIFGEPALDLGRVLRFDRGGYREKQSYDGERDRIMA
jgi:hypothetical protein